MHEHGHDEPGSNVNKPVNWRWQYDCIEGIIGTTPKRGTTGRVTVGPATIIVAILEFATSTSGIGATATTTTTATATTTISTTTKATGIGDCRSNSR